MKRPLWAGGYTTGPAKVLARLSESVHFDKALAPYDLAGSIAHAEGLGRARIIPRAYAMRLVAGLRVIWRVISAGKFRWNPDLEDVHMNIEADLTRRLGETGKCLHTGRSRNDQVATSFRLYCADHAARVRRETAGLGAALSRAAARHAGLVWPGFTHWQPAQPVTFGHLLAAHAEALARDCDRLARAEADALADCPLGSGALAGATLPLDRAHTARRLGFRRPAPNAQDAVGQRDFALDLLHSLATLAIHLSRLGEEIVLFAGSGLVRLDDRVTTGSSIMPQKKNPDVAELARGKAGRAIGNLVRLAVVLKGLPLAYNRDLQEDKESVFDSVDQALLVLPAMTLLVETLRPAAEAARRAIDPSSLATDLAEALVEEGVPFREAHEKVAALAAGAKSRNVPFLVAARRAFPRFVARLTPEEAVRRRGLVGGPAPARVRSHAKTLARGFGLHAKAPGAAVALKLLHG